MSKIIDISSTSRGKSTIKAVNQNNLFREIRVYQYKNCCFLYCITNYNALHISGSSPSGPVTKKDLSYVFKKLTDKPITNFKLMKTERALYLLEEKATFLN